jgi:hypothetical protein
MSTPTFVALYRGGTVAEARLVAVSAQEELVVLVAEHLLKSQVPTPAVSADPVLRALAESRAATLAHIASELREAARP